ncbi:putative signal peptide protein [Puccinia sorghi]|uniref:Putative signal peptide protein n=1 Tax=Puccinia sorghi TaxID=27349 RepID=A0A0L6V212_9BASI|nr:putative signal peptide protein [Puccinia sorghi]
MISYLEYIWLEALVDLILSLIIICAADAAACFHSQEKKTQQDGEGRVATFRSAEGECLLVGRGKGSKVGVGGRKGIIGQGSGGLTWVCQEQSQAGRGRVASWWRVQRRRVARWWRVQRRRVVTWSRKMVEADDKKKWKKIKQKKEERKKKKKIESNLILCTSMSDHWASLTLCVRGFNCHPPAIIQLVLAGVVHCSVDQLRATLHFLLENGYFEVQNLCLLGDSSWKGDYLSQANWTDNQYFGPYFNLLEVVKILGPFFFFPRLGSLEEWLGGKNLISLNFFPRLEVGHNDLNKVCIHARLDMGIPRAFPLTSNWYGGCAPEVLRALFRWIEGILKTKIQGLSRFMRTNFSVVEQELGEM